MFITSGDGSKTMPWRNGVINIEKHSLKAMQEISWIIIPSSFLVVTKDD